MYACRNIIMHQTDYSIQLETEKLNAERKVQMLEDDLEKAEDQLATVKANKAELETRVDDLERYKHKFSLEKKQCIVTNVHNVSIYNLCETFWQS